MPISKEIPMWVYDKAIKNLQNRRAFGSLKSPTSAAGLMSGGAIGSSLSGADKISPREWNDLKTRMFGSSSLRQKIQLPIQDFNNLVKEFENLAALYAQGKLSSSGKMIESPKKGALSPKPQSGFQAGTSSAGAPKATRPGLFGLHKAGK